MRPRVVFLGNHPWSVPPLVALARGGFDVALVVTRPPRPAGRGSVLRPTDVATAAAGADLPVLEAETVRSGPGFDALISARPDVLVVVAYGEILTPEVLAVATPVNVHFSLLPRWRGAAPVHRAILSGDAETGVTTMLMDQGLDTGPILLQRPEAIDPREDAGTLGSRLAEIGGALLAQTLQDLDAIQPVPQRDSLATVAPKLTAAERRLDWSVSSVDVAHRVRGMAPIPGAFTQFRGQALKVLRGEAIGAAGPPAEVRVGSDGVTVGTADGGYRLLEVIPAGKRRMTAEDWAHGIRVVPGERFE